MAARAEKISLLLLSAATLAFEINLTRLFSVTQFYHFAFMIVSLALLGFGASGAILAVYGRWWGRRGLDELSLGMAAGILGAYLLTNLLPFDSFRIAWDLGQLGVLALHYLALAAPFFFSGMAVAVLLNRRPQSAGQTYAINLAGSALGCLAALLLPPFLGGVGMVTLSSALAALAGVIAARRSNGEPAAGERPGRPPARWVGLAALLLLVFNLLDVGLRGFGRPTLPLLDLQISLYKSLAYALQYPGAELVSQRWNAFSRVDVVSSPGIRSLPGVSYRYPHSPPPQHGLLVDGDDLSPLVLPGGEMAFTAYMPSALAYRLRPAANTLLLETRGGLEALVALEEGAARLLVVEPNPLVVEAAAPLYAYDGQRVEVDVEIGRSYLQRSRDEFDIIVLPLTSAYHPVNSGAYSLAEDYRYTLEAFEDMLARLEADGLLVFSRWLQTPPSECLRAFGLAVTALERQGYDPAQRIVAFRSFNQITLLVKKAPFEAWELQMARRFSEERAFDLVYAPDLREDEVNRFNVLAEPLYWQAFTQLLAAGTRPAWYAQYPFDVTPPTDDHPFFGHYFKGSQAAAVLAEMGKTWQPFGGAGYFVLLLLLGLALAAAGLVILLPAAVAARRAARRPAARLPSPAWQRAAAAYFVLIGLGYLLVEIPLIQRFILYLGHPAYALTTVLFSVLLFSGLGSALSGRLPHRPPVAALALLAVSMLVWLPALMRLTLGLSLAARLGVSVAALAPLGFLMGIPFPRGVQLVERAAPQLIPWVWGVNAAASVVSSVLAALLALSLGFRWALLAGVLCYSLVWLILPAMAGRPAAGRG